jgi:predicted acyltransferase (DUF342 family)
MISVDRERGLLIVKKDAIITKHIKFDGKIIAGINSSFWGNIEGNEVYLAKGCSVGGKIKCKRAVVGAHTNFNSIEAEEVIVLKKCRGGSIRAEGDVRIIGECIIGEVVAGRILIEGSAKIERMEARKILAFGSS